MKMWNPFRKKKTPSRRSYQGAIFGRLVDDWVANSTSMDSEVRSSLRKLRDRSRQLGRDNDYVRSIFRTIQNNVVGEGVTFQSQVRMQRGGELNTTLNDNIELAWSRWCSAANCDTAGKLDFQDIEKLIIRNVIESGEIFIRKINAPFGDSKVPFALEIIESDICDDLYNGVSEAGNDIRMGVELNGWGRPVNYFFLPKHPGDYNMSGQGSRTGPRIKVPANEIIHLFICERAKQTRGVPLLSSTLNRLNQMNGYEEAEIIAARASACLMGFIETPSGELQGDAVEDGDRVTEFGPGMIKKLNEGEKMNVPQISRPGNQFDPFMRLMLRGCSAGAGASYESVSKDYSQGSYSSTRQALLEDRDNFKIIQKWLIRKFHQNVYCDWLDRAVLSGELSIPGYFVDTRKYTESVKWMPRGWSWIDPLKEVEAYRMGVRNGFITQTEVVAQSGGDFEELCVTRKRERDFAKKCDIMFDTDPDYAPPSSPTSQNIPVDEGQPNSSNGSGGKKRIGEHHTWQ